MGRFGQIANAVSLALAVFGTQNIMKNFGLTTCLLAFPACTAGLIATVFVYPNLWVLFAGMVSIKVCLGGGVGVVCVCVCVCYVYVCVCLCVHPQSYPPSSQGPGLLLERALARDALCSHK